MGMPVQAGRLRDLGLDEPSWETVLYAMMGLLCLRGLHNFVPLCTGATRAVVGGKICPGANLGELEQATGMLAARVDLGENEGDVALRGALDLEVLRCQERLFLLLSVIHPAATVMKIWSTWRDGTSRGRALAVAQAILRELVRRLRASL